MLFDGRTFTHAAKLTRVNTNTPNPWQVVYSHFHQRCQANEVPSADADSREIRTPEERCSDPVLSLISDGWLAGRMLFWPHGLSSLWRISLVSSRLPERRDLCSWWYDALRTTCARCNPANETLIAVPGTTCFDPIVRASELFGIPRLEVNTPLQTTFETEAAINWLDSNLHDIQHATPQNELATKVYVSPVLQNAPVDRKNESETDIAEWTETTDAPVRDIVNFAMADRIIMLHCRQNGHIWKLANELLSQKAPSIVMLAQTKQHRHDVDDLLARGIVPWLLFEDTPAQETNQPVKADSSQRPTVRPEQAHFESDPIRHPDDWLCHWTRPFRSAWPDQPADDFLDELILGCESADRSALAALIRIADQKKLLATVARQDECPTVSFTSVSLSAFRERRIFRSHRRRYDFEPYGIAVRKSNLVRLGAHPVQYVDDGSSNEIPHSHEATEATEATPFQQPRFDRTGKIDWSTEKEWRLPGDLDLSTLGGSSVVVFVNDETERARFPATCDWPVVVVPDSNQPSGR